MNNRYGAINEAIRSKMLSLFKNAKELEKFITTHPFMPNAKTETGGGDMWYTDIVEIDGWRVQQHHFPGLEGHYRILDDEDKRRAWVLKPERLLRALQEYEAEKKEVFK